MADATRDTIYVDIDDEITGIIDKLRASDAKIVALVLPKRASVFQSIVNMKLLKRATEQSKKRIVLITSEAGLLPLAGAVGVHVASSLTSKPEIPTAPIADDGKEETVEESASLEDNANDNPEIAPNTPVGELAGLTEAAALPPPPKDDVETIELDNDETGDSEDKSGKKSLAAADSNAPKKPKKNKKLKIPNFERFRLILSLAIVAIVLIVALIVALRVLPKASIAVQTDASDVNATVTFTPDASATSLNATTGDTPAKMVSETKTYTGSVTTTGQQNNGQQASGTVIMTASQCAPNLGFGPSTIPAGTGISSNNLTYITQQDAIFSSKPKGSCIYYTSNNVNISAQSPGSAYNTSSTTTTFSVANNPGVSATGSATGGTDNIQQIVSQSDIANAEAKISPDISGAKQDLTQQLEQDNLFPLPVTFVNNAPAVTTSAAAGAPATSLTATGSVLYTMYGVPEADLNTLLNNNIKTQLSDPSQGIISNGLNSASFTAATPGSSNTLTLTATAEVGPNINVTNIKQLSFGKKSADVITAIKNIPNVTNVTVHLSPFWVTTVPNNSAKITVKIAKPTSASSNAGN